MPRARTRVRRRGRAPPILRTATWSYPRWRVDAHPCWTPDGSGVLYTDMATGTAQLRQVDTVDLVP